MQGIVAREREPTRPGAIQTYQWALTLACGHTVRRYHVRGDLIPCHHCPSLPPRTKRRIDVRVQEAITMIASLPSEQIAGLAEFLEADAHIQGGPPDADHELADSSRVVAVLLRLIEQQVLEELATFSVLTIDEVRDQAFEDAARGIEQLQQIDQVGIGNGIAAAIAAAVRAMKEEA